jgi:hypothetical protein
MTNHMLVSCALNAWPSSAGKVAAPHDAPVIVSFWTAPSIADLGSIDQARPLKAANTRKLTEWRAMGAESEDATSSAQTLRGIVDTVIFEALEQDPTRVIRALQDVVERCKAQGRYTADEIDAAAAQLRTELGIPSKLN